jgi:ribosomal peptide maturation radical SAM protein 1
MKHTPQPLHPSWDRFASASHYDVLLINMPYSSLFSPSLGLGLLQSSLKQRGVTVKTLDLNLNFAQKIGLDCYQTVQGQTLPEHLVGEWIFAEALFADGRNQNHEQYFQQILRANTIDEPDRPVYEEPFRTELEAAILNARAAANDFIQDCLAEVLACTPLVVGFTSMFQQQVASLALAKSIKYRRPECAIVFGGSNCEGPMGAELFRQFDFIDVLVSGEADQVFPEIIAAIRSSEPIPRLTGVHDRRRPRLPVTGQKAENTPMVTDLDSLPVPDYDDFFHRLKLTGFTSESKKVLLFESSRGCWWGEKQHCTFCGLNGSTMKFRSKSAERVMEELLYLNHRFPECRINAVDNILDMKYFKTLMKMLAAGNYDFGLFYEVKANLRKDQLRLLRQAGIDVIQPGIESLSDNVLRLMRKGVSALQNIQLLKWCSELNLHVLYNIIWGFPGETPQDYRRSIEVMPLISHLRPPVGAGTIRIDRFSPNFNENAALGFNGLKPFPAYGLVYPFDERSLFDLAYYFISAPAEALVGKSDTEGLSRGIRQWKTDHDNSDLFFWDKGTKLLIWDMRPAAQTPLSVLDEFGRAAYLACDGAVSARQLHEGWENSTALPWDEARLTDTLDSFVDRALMLKDDEQYLALAYPKQVAELPSQLTR